MIARQEDDLGELGKHSTPVLERNLSDMGHGLLTQAIHLAVALFREPTAEDTFVLPVQRHPFHFSGTRLLTLVDKAGAGSGIPAESSFCPPPQVQIFSVLRVRWKSPRLNQQVMTARGIYKWPQYRFRIVYVLQLIHLALAFISGYHLCRFR